MKMASGQVKVSEPLPYTIITHDTKNNYYTDRTEHFGCDYSLAKSIRQSS